MLIVPWLKIIILTTHHPEWPISVTDFSDQHFFVRLLSLVYNTANCYKVVWIWRQSHTECFETRPSVIQLFEYEGCHRQNAADDLIICFFHCNVSALYADSMTRIAYKINKRVKLRCVYDLINYNYPRTKNGTVVKLRQCGKVFQQCQLNVQWHMDNHIKNRELL